MKRLLMLTCLLILVPAIGPWAGAQIPRTLSYQGILTDSLGVVKPDGDYTITFRLWDTETDGSWLWKEALTLTVKKGLFAAELGSVTPFPSTVKFDKPYWLSLQLVPEPEMTPRLPLSSVAYSMSALSTDSARIAGTVPNNAVTSTKLADGAVTSVKIADGTIQRADLAAGVTVGRADTATFAQLSGTVLDNAITSAKILNGSIQLTDLAQNGAAEGQVLKWTGGAWAAAADATGGGSGGGTTIDSARIAGTVPAGAITTSKLADGAVTSVKVADGTILFTDIAQNGAATGQVIKWNGSAWEAATPATGAASGWTDNGTAVGLTTASDTVALNTGLRLGKLNLTGDIGLNGESGLYFGSRNTYLEALPGEHLTLHANQDLKLQAGNDLRLYGTGTMTVLAGDNLNLGHYGDASWMKLDNTNKRVGIGMGTSDPVDDRLHVKNELASNCWARIESAHPSSWGQAGLRIKTPQNTWHLRMDAAGNANFPDGALSLYNSGGGSFETMTWLKDGKVGIGTPSPWRRLHVNGSAQVKDTLYAGTINADRIVGEPGVVHVRRATKTLGDSYAPIDSLTVNAPGPGYILLFFSGTLYSDHTFADRTYVRMSITTGRDGSGNLGKVEWQVDVQNPSAYCQIPMAVQGVLQVASKGSYEFFAGGHSAVTAYTPDRVTAQNIAFTALFVPSAYGSVEATPPPDPPPLDDVAARMDEPRRTDNSLESEVLALKQELQAIRNQLDSNRK